MQTIKLHEATKQFKISNKLAMFFLEKINMPVKSHSSVISMDQLELLREFSGGDSKYAHVTEEFNNKEKAKKAKQKKAKQEPEAKEETPKEAAPAADKKEPPKKEVKPEPAAEKPPKETKKKPPLEKPQAKAAKEEKPKPPPETAAKEEKPEPPRKERIEPRKKTKKPEKFEKRVKPAAEKEEKREKREDRDRARRPQKAEARRDKAFPKEKAVPERPKAEEVRGRPERPADRKRRAPERPAEQKKKRPERPAGEKRKDRRFDDRKKGKPEQNRKPQGRRDDRRREWVEPPRKVKAPPVKPKPKIEDFDLPEMIQISNYITLKELAEKLNLKLKYVEDKMKLLKKEYAANQILETGDIKTLCEQIKVEVDIISFEDYIHFNYIEKFKAQLQPRPPVVTVMGHVDHGKTTLLDTLRHTSIADKEAGGITQKIGAYKLDTGGQSIIFLDTPGHEAFTNIRSRGARVTDVVILIVAANDGVKPQTIEAINHAQAAEVPLIVAINKIDLAGADPNKVKQELTKHNIVVEEWGGDVVCIEISAKQNQNLDSLIEMVGLVAEMLELKAYKDIPGRGVIIESRLDPQLGPIGTVLIQHGKIKRGDFFICGNSVGKVKSLFDDKGKALQEAEVPHPVEIMGFADVPEAGELFQVTDDQEKAYKVIDMRKQEGKEARREELDAGKKFSLETLFEKIEEDKSKDFPVIIKTDNFSSGEVLESILMKQSRDELKVNILHSGIGNITESDILLASTSDAIIIGFNVKAPQKIISLAKRENIEIKLYNVIYHLIEDMERAIKGEIKPEYKETRIGTIEVLQKFKISKIGIIAGCLVKEGKVTNKSKLKVIRDNDLVFEGELETLRRVKNDASEVNAGTECGIRIKNFNDIEVGDILEAYELSLKE